MKKIGVIMLLIASMLLPGCSKNPLETTATEGVESTAGTFPNRSDTLQYVKRVGFVTGESGFVNTMERFNVMGTDLGIPYYDPENGRLTLLFGDTYSGKNFSGNWRSNVALYTTQTDYSTGIALTGALTANGAAENGFAVQITPGSAPVVPLLQGDAEKTPNTHSCIPTGAVVVDGTIYVFYMEIDKNGFPPSGGWGVYCNRVVKSEDHGQTWKQVPGLVWQANDNTEHDGVAPNFAQIYPLQVEDYIYIYGICGGRSGGTKLGRVPKDQIEDFEAYEYFTGYDDSGNPKWRKGTSGLQYIKQRESAYLIDLPCGEMCVTFNAYLNKYLAIYQSGSNLVYRTADTPYGPFSSPEIILTTSGDMDSAYGAFTCEQLSDMDGQRIWILVSEWTPIYNVSQIEIMFK